MALVSPSPIVSTISGALGGSVFRRGRGSIVACHRTRNNVSRGARALAARARFAWAIRAWALLSPTTRAAWDTMARQIQSKDRLGAARQISGRSLFLHAELLSLEANAGTDTGLLRSFSQPPMIAYLLEISASGASYAYYISQDNSTARYVMFWGATAFASQSLSAARSWRYLGRIAWSSGTTIDPGPPTLKRFTVTSFLVPALGTLQEGQVVAIRARAALFSATKGLPGPIVTLAAGVTA